MTVLIAATVLLRKEKCVCTVIIHVESKEKQGKS